MALKSLGNSIVGSDASIPSHAIWQRDLYEEWELFRRVQRCWQGKVWTQRHSRGEKLRCKFLARKSAKLFANTKCKFLARKSAKLFANTKCKFLARKSAKLIANFSVKMVTSLPSFFLYLSLSLSLSPSVPHAQNSVTDYSSTKNSSTKTPRYDRRSNDKSRIRKVHDTKFPWRENSSLRQCTTWQIPDATYRRCVSFATRNVTDAKTPRKNFPRKVSYSWRLLVVGLLTDAFFFNEFPACMYELPWP